MWDWQSGHCVFFLTHLLRQERWQWCMHSILATFWPSRMRLRQMAQLWSVRPTTSHSILLRLALAYSFQKSHWQEMPRPALEVQQSSEQCIEWPSSVYSCSSGCYCACSSWAFCASVSISPAAKRKRYLRSRKEDSEMLISACLNCLCSYSSRMMSAMQMEESRNSGTEGNRPASRYELKKRETFTDAISTAFTDTSFIPRALQSHPIIYYHPHHAHSHRLVFPLQHLPQWRGGVEIFSVLLKMEQKGQKRGVRQSRSPNGNGSHIGERISTIGHSRTHDSRSKLHSSRDSELREFKKGRAKLNTLSSIGSLAIEEQIKREMAQALEVLRQAASRLKQRKVERSQKQQLVALEELIRQKDEDIRGLTGEIEQLKKSDKNVPQEDSQPSTQRNTEASDKERMFKLAEEMRSEREELARCAADHGDRLAGYLKLKKLIDEIEQKYARGEAARGLPSYQEFKERQRAKKEEPKIKKVDFYHHLSPDKQASPSKNMKDLITRKNITLAALKNSRKKHAVEMNELFAKIEFLKDEDTLLTQKIQEKEQELASMEKKFSERKGSTQRADRNAVLHFHS